MGSNLLHDVKTTVLFDGFIWTWRVVYQQEVEMQQWMESSRDRVELIDQVVAE